MTRRAALAIPPPLLSTMDEDLENRIGRVGGGLLRTPHIGDKDDDSGDGNRSNDNENHGSIPITCQTSHATNPHSAIPAVKAAARLIAIKVSRAVTKSSP